MRLRHPFAVTTLATLALVVAVGCSRNPTSVSGVPAGGQEALVSIAAGYQHTCALRASGTVVCWGIDVRGSLGGPEPRLAGSSFESGGLLSMLWGPVEAAGLNDATQLSVGRGFACVRLRRGTVACWGDNEVGQLGIAPDLLRHGPTEVPSLADVVHVTAGSSRACARRRDGTLVCWGNGLGPSRELPALAGVVEVALRDNQACAIVEEGRIVCWGNGPVVAAGAARDSTGLAPIQGITGATSLALGTSHACALVAGGKTLCWGDNGYGQLGEGDWGQHRTTPAPLTGAGPARAVVAGNDHTCILQLDGRVACAGANQWNQCGQFPNGSRTKLAEVPNMRDVRVLTAGGFQTCALTTSGTALCLGKSYRGAPSTLAVR